MSMYTRVSSVSVRLVDAIDVHVAAVTFVFACTMLAKGVARVVPSRRRSSAVHVLQSSTVSPLSAGICRVPIAGVSMRRLSRRSCVLLARDELLVGCPPPSMGDARLCAGPASMILEKNALLLHNLLVTRYPTPLARLSRKGAASP